MPPISEPNGPPGNVNPPGAPAEFRPPQPGQPFPTSQGPPTAPPPGYGYPTPPPYQPPGQGYQPPGQGYQPPGQGYQPPGQPPGGPYPYQQYPGYPGYGYAPALPDHPSATTALVLGLVAIIGLFICGVTILLAPFAWMTGARAVAEIDADPSRFGGRDKARAGQILGIIGTVILGLLIAGFLLFVVAVMGTATSSSF